MERVLPDIEDAVNANVKLLNQKTVYKKIFHSEVLLQLGEAIPTRKVTKTPLVLASLETTPITPAHIST